MKSKKWSYKKALYAVLRFTRRLALKHKLPLGRFKQTHPFVEDPADLGPQWLATEIRNGRRFVTVWYVIGEVLEEEARENCSLVKEYGTTGADRFVFGISFYPPLTP